MRILMVGGGSGGHVTPLKAVAEQILDKYPNTQIEVVTDRRFGSQTREIFASIPDIKITEIYAGKFRRYNGKSLAWHLLHLPTVLKNLFDILLVGLGTIQSILKFIKNKPDVVFYKGGFVSVPVGLAARLFKLPMIIHDSDTHAGLSSRIISRWASKIATGMPTKYYDYPSEKMIYTGIPVDEGYSPITEKLQQKLKKQLGFDSAPLVLVTGGGTGAERLNSLLERVGERLVERGWQIVQITGKGKSEPAVTARSELKKSYSARWIIEEFKPLKDYILAADVVVTRTGATTMQELANSQKTVVTIPSRFLSGGHQLKNAQMFQDADAARFLDELILEEKPEILIEALEIALSDKSSSVALKNKFAKPGAAKQLADLIMGLAD